MRKCCQKIPKNYKITLNLTKSGELKHSQIRGRCLTRNSVKNTNIFFKEEFLESPEIQQISTQSGEFILCREIISNVLPNSTPMSKILVLLWHHSIKSKFPKFVKNKLASKSFLKWSQFQCFLSTSPWNIGRKKNRTKSLKP